jgi:hypothetical protein
VQSASGVAWLGRAQAASCDARTVMKLALYNSLCLSYHSHVAQKRLVVSADLCWCGLLGLQPFALCVGKGDYYT